MRRTKRLWHAGLLFLVYSCLYVYSDKSSDKTLTESHLKDGPSVEETLARSNDESIEPTPTFKKDMLEISTLNGTVGEDMSSSSTTTEPTTPRAHHVHPTWRPKRQNCSPPAIEQFPKPLMSPNVRKHGGNYHRSGCWIIRF